MGLNVSRLWTCNASKSLLSPPSSLFSLAISLYKVSYPKSCLKPMAMVSSRLLFLFSICILTSQAFEQYLLWGYRPKEVWTAHP